MTWPTMCSSSVVIPRSIGEDIAPNKGVLDVTSDFLINKFSTAGKAWYVYSDLALLCDPSLNEVPGFSETSLAFRWLKLSKAPGTIVKNTTKAAGDCCAFWGKRDVHHGAKAILSLNGIVAPCWETADLLSRAVVHLPKQSITWIKGISGWSMILGFGHGVLESVSKIFDWTLPIGSSSRGVDGKSTEKKENKSATKEFLKLVENATYLALGVLTVLLIFWGIPITPATFTIISAVNVTSTILHYYCENLNKKCKLVDGKL